MCKSTKNADKTAFSSSKTILLKKNVFFLGHIQILTYLCTRE